MAKQTKLIVSAEKVAANVRGIFEAFDTGHAKKVAASQAMVQASETQLASMVRALGKSKKVFTLEYLVSAYDALHDISPETPVKQLDKSYVDRRGLATKAACLLTNGYAVPEGCNSVKTYVETGRNFAKEHELWTVRDSTGRKGIKGGKGGKDDKKDEGMTLDQARTIIDQFLESRPDGANRKMLFYKAFAGNPNDIDAIVVALTQSGLIGTKPKVTRGKRKLEKAA